MADAAATAAAATSGKPNEGLPAVRCATRIGLARPAICVPRGPGLEGCPGRALLLRLRLVCRCALRSVEGGALRGGAIGIEPRQGHFFTCLGQRRLKRYVKVVRDFEPEKVADLLLELPEAFRTRLDADLVDLAVVLNRHDGRHSTGEGVWRRRCKRADPVWEPLEAEAALGLLTAATLLQLPARQASLVDESWAFARPDQLLGRFRAQADPTLLGVVLTTAPIPLGVRRGSAWQPRHRLCRHSGSAGLKSLQKIPDRGGSRYTGG